MAMILIVEDDLAIQGMLKEVLEDAGYEVLVASNGKTAHALYKAHAFDLLLLDIWMPDTDGLTLLHEWNTHGKRTMPALVMSSYDESAYKVRLATLGAAAFLSKPMPREVLLTAVSHALMSPNECLVAHVPGRLKASMGDSAAVHGLERRLAELALTRAPVLMTGEAGAPLLECAKIIAGGDTPFMVLDMEATTRLREATKDLLERVRGGCLFIPNVATLNQDAQNGLLIVLNRMTEYGLRVICGSEALLGVWANEGRFSKQVYAVICDNAVRIPPLRERREDIPVLLAEWLPEISKELGLGEYTFTPEAIHRLQTARDWLGNESELRRHLTGLLLLAENPCLDEAVVRRHLGVPAESPLFDGFSQLFALPMTEAENGFARAYLIAVLERFNYNKTAVARFCGRDRSTIHNRINELGIPVNRED
jgi:two-component system, NtrC family, nitrogen regulation response regulator NtrX